MRPSECLTDLTLMQLTTGQCHITSQNHGYAVDTSTLPSEFIEYFVNLNDGSNEGKSSTMPCCQWGACMFFFVTNVVVY